MAFFSGRGLVDCTCRSQNGELVIGVGGSAPELSIGVKSPRGSLAPGATGAGEVSVVGSFAVVVIAAVVAVAAGPAWLCAVCLRQEHACYYCSSALRFELGLDSTGQATQRILDPVLASN